MPLSFGPPRVGLPVQNSSDPFNAQGYYPWADSNDNYSMLGWWRVGTAFYVMTANDLENPGPSMIQGPLTVWVTIDGGLSWTQKSTSSNAQTQPQAFAFDGNDTVYIASLSGVSGWAVIVSSYVVSTDTWLDSVDLSFDMTVLEPLVINSFYTTYSLQLSLHVFGSGKVLALLSTFGIPSGGDGFWSWAGFLNVPGLSWNAPFPVTRNYCDQIPADEYSDFMPVWGTSGNNINWAHPTPVVNGNSLAIILYYQGWDGINYITNLAATIITIDDTGSVTFANQEYVTDQTVSLNYVALLLGTNVVVFNLISWTTFATVIWDGMSLTQSLVIFTDPNQWYNLDAIVDSTGTLYVVYTDPGDNNIYIYSSTDGLLFAGPQVISPGFALSTTQNFQLAQLIDGLGLFLQLPWYWDGQSGDPAPPPIPLPIYPGATNTFLLPLGAPPPPPTPAIMRLSIPTAIALPDPAVVCRGRRPQHPEFQRRKC